MELMPMPPIISMISWFHAGDQIDQPLIADFRIQPLDQLRTLGRDAPVALARLAGAAQVAAQRQQRRRGDIYRVRA